MATNSKIDGLLLRKFARRNIAETLASMDPGFEAISKRQGPGKPDVSVEVNLSAGRSHSATTAENNADEGQEVLFQGVYSKDFGALKLNHANFIATNYDPDAISSNLDREINRKERTLMRSACQQFYGDGGHSQGEIAAISGSTVTLVKKSSARQLAGLKGAKVVFADSSATGALRDSGDTLTIQSVDVATKVVTFDSAVSGVAGAAVGDHIVLEGDAAAGGAVKGFPGLSAWISPTATTLFGVPRANYSRNILCGSYVDLSGSGDPVLTKLRDGLVEVIEGSEHLGSQKLAITRLSTFNEISKTINGSNFFNAGNVEKTDAGHRKLCLSMGGITVDLVASFFAPEDEIFVIDTAPEALEMLHLGPKPMGPMQIKDSPIFQRSGENFQALYYSYMWMAMGTPSAHGRIILA